MSRRATTSRIPHFQDAIRRNLRVQDRAGGDCCTSCRHWSSGNSEVGYCLSPRSELKRSPSTRYWNICDWHDNIVPVRSREPGPAPASGPPVAPATDGAKAPKVASGGAGAEPPTCSECIIQAMNGDRCEGPCRIVAASERLAAQPTRFENSEAEHYFATRDGSGEAWS